MSFLVLRSFRHAALATLFAAGMASAPTASSLARTPDIEKFQNAPSALDRSALGSGGSAVKSAACERIGALADRLGESYAGHRLRASLIEYNCLMTHAASAQKVWGWPWRAFERSDLASAGTTGSTVDEDLLPLRLRRQTGAWQIRCDKAGVRERCALSQREHDGPTPVVVHFVIDRIAGKSSVLFRLYAPRPPAGLNAAVVDLGAGPVRIPFDTCAGRGCILEATPQQSSTILGRLWENQPLNVRLQVATGEASAELHAVDLGAQGFRDGFKELLNLDRGDVIRPSAP